MSHEWVLIRGLAREHGHSEAFEQRLREADPNASVISVDLPGAGDYFRLSSPLSVEGIAEFVYSHLEHPQKKPRYLVAISLGGMIATEIARLYPQEIDGVFLINSSFSNLSPVWSRLRPQALMHMYRAITAENDVEKERAVLDMVSNRMDRHELIADWAAISQERPVSLANFAKQLFAAATYSAPEEKPPCPFYVLCSDADRMVKSECSKLLAEKWKVPLEVHSSGGHDLWLDEPDWVIEKLFQFAGKPELKQP